MFSSKSGWKRPAACFGRGITVRNPYSWPTATCWASNRRLAATPFRSAGRRNGAPARGVRRRERHVAHRRLSGAVSRSDRARVQGCDLCARAVVRRTIPGRERFHRLPRTAGIDLPQGGTRACGAHGGLLPEASVRRAGRLRGPHRGGASAAGRRERRRVGGSGRIERGRTVN